MNPVAINPAHVIHSGNLVKDSPALPRFPSCDVVANPKIITWDSLFFHGANAARLNALVRNPSGDDKTGIFNAMDLLTKLFGTSGNTEVTLEQENDTGYHGGVNATGGIFSGEASILKARKGNYGCAELSIEQDMGEDLDRKTIKFLESLLYRVECAEESTPFVDLWNYEKHEESDDFSLAGFNQYPFTLKEMRTNVNNGFINKPNVNLIIALKDDFDR